MTDEKLRQALRDLASESANAEARPQVRTALRKAVRARHTSPMVWWRAAAAAVTVGVLAAGVARISEWPAPAPSQVEALTPWYFSAGMPPAESGQWIRLEVPADTAARFGVVANGPVQADLIIGDDGLTRAIRFVQ
ncbi:MAG: hypothetical protein KJZ84_05270 [Bryobacteraceae bacterium]|nr:hypothetical protein [Bryobacteraceae bacterium]